MDSLLSGDGSVLQVFHSGAPVRYTRTVRSVGKPFGVAGRLSQLMDCNFRSPERHSDGRGGVSGKVELGRIFAPAPRSGRALVAPGKTQWASSGNL